MSLRFLVAEKILEFSHIKIPSTVLFSTKLHDWQSSKNWSVNNGGY